MSEFCNVHDKMVMKIKGDGGNFFEKLEITLEVQRGCTGCLQSAPWAMGVGGEGREEQDKAPVNRTVGKVLRKINRSRSAWVS